MNGEALEERVRCKKHQQAWMTEQAKKGGESRETNSVQKEAAFAGKSLLSV